MIMIFMVLEIFESAFLRLQIIYSFLSSFCFMLIQVRYIILQYNTVDIAHNLKDIIHLKRISIFFPNEVYY
jgi:hypothetical protein